MTVIEGASRGLNWPACCLLRLLSMHSAVRAMLTFSMALFTLVTSAAAFPTLLAGLLSLASGWAEEGVEIIMRAHQRACLGQLVR